MTHRKDLLKQKYCSKGYGTKTQMEKKAQQLKQAGKIKNYRVVPYGNKWELYAK